jgi:hypothetical protein
MVNLNNQNTKHYNIFKKYFDLFTLNSFSGTKIAYIKTQLSGYFKISLLNNFKMSEQLLKIQSGILTTRDLSITTTLIDTNRKVKYD